MLEINVRTASVLLTFAKITLTVPGLTRPAMLTMITASTVVAVTVLATLVDAVKVGSLCPQRKELSLKLLYYRMSHG